MMGTLPGYTESMRHMDEIQRDAAHARLVHELRDARRAERAGDRHEGKVLGWLNRRGTVGQDSRSAA